MSVTNVMMNTPEGCVTVPPTGVTVVLQSCRVCKGKSVFPMGKTLEPYPTQLQHLSPYTSQGSVHSEGVHGDSPNTATKHIILPLRGSMLPLVALYVLLLCWGRFLNATALVDPVLHNTYWINKGCSIQETLKYQTDVTIGSVSLSRRESSIFDGHYIYRPYRYIGLVFQPPSVALLFQPDTQNTQNTRSVLSIYDGSCVLCYIPVGCVWLKKESR